MSLSRRKKWILGSAVALSATALLILASASLAEEKQADGKEPKDSEKSGGFTLRDLLQTWFPHHGGDGTTDDEETTPAALESQAGDILGPADFLSPEELRNAGPWKAPDYSNQTGALGYDEKSFTIPPAFKERVAFWTQIYTKYTTNQGVIHDRDDLSIVYENVDFNSIMADRSLSPRQKAKAREKLVKQKRDDIIAILKKLNERSKTIPTSEGLSGTELRYWNLWSGYKSEDKFSVAAEKNHQRFQLGQRDRFIVGIYHSGRYIHRMEKIFRDEKIPIELTRLPFVESSFNIHARSRVGASGIWQFMRRTAKPFMKVTKDVDERNDPLKATLASARLLRQNFSMLRDWPLAVTGYNHGPYGVKNIVAKTGTNDLATIIDKYSSKTFGFASSNFYACLLAAIDAEKNAKQYFGEVKWGPEMEGVEIHLDKPLAYRTVVQFFDDDEAAAELANFHVLAKVKKAKALIPKGSFIRVPEARAELAKSYLAGTLPPSQLAVRLKAQPIESPSTQPLAPVKPPVLPEAGLTAPAAQ